MKLNGLILFFTLLAFFSNEISVHAQIKEPVKWEYSSTKLDDDTYMLIFKADIDDGWKVYATDLIIPEDKTGPVPTSINYDSNKGFKLIEDLEQLGNIEGPIYEPLFDMALKWFKEKAILRQKITLEEEDVRISGFLEFMTCDDTECLPPAEVPFEFVFGDPPDTSDANGEVADPDEEVDEESNAGDKTGDPEEENGGLWGFFILGLGGGLIALLTPCVFPMIPLTVSFFTKSSRDRKQGIANALIYALSIIVIFVSLGFLFSIFAGPDALNAMASNRFVNLIFFLVFVIFALSFFGLFELNIPSKWVNQADSVSEKGGLLGIFFMAFTLVLISFSCTVPIIGSIMVLITESGQVMGPLVGMLGFSVMLAVPFAVFAAFPGWLNSLPKSGSWLNTVKVCLGFVELALALKFLSIVDLAYHWNFLTRDIFIALWIILAILLGVYLLGKLRLSHESVTETVSVPRLILAIFAFAFAIYLIPGMWGAPVKLLSGIAPPQHYQEFNLNELQYKIKNLEHQITSIQGTENEEPRNPNRVNDDLIVDAFPPPPPGMECPHELDCFFDLSEAIEHARHVDKPLLIDFTGWSCVNCRKMEEYVWSEPEVWEKLKQDYVLVSLYVDEKTSLPEEFRTSPYTGNEVGSFGKLWSDLQTEWFNTNSQPYYVLFDPRINDLSEEVAEESVLIKPIGYTPNVNKYMSFLNEGLEKYNARKYDQQAQVVE